MLYDSLEKPSFKKNFMLNILIFLLQVLLMR